SLSQFQALAGVPIWRARHLPEVRNLLIKQYARMLGSFGLLTTLMIMAGFDVEEDSRSTDFIKFRKGRTRIDMGTGLLQPIVLISRLQQIFPLGERGPGKQKSPVTGKVRDIDINVPFGFVRSKLSPLVGMALDIGLGSNVVGEPVSVSTVEGVMDLAENQLLPISIQDIIEVLKEEDNLSDIAIFGLLSILGQGISTFPSVDKPETAEEKREKKARRKRLLGR
ncbi:MAG: hypothetical protein ACR2MX_10975, partial [Cyclobacteriaceae bacterium]